MPYKRVKSHTKKIRGRLVRVRSYIKRVPTVKKKGSPKRRSR